MQKRLSYLFVSLIFFLSATCSSVEKDVALLATATLRPLPSSTPTSSSESPLTPIGTPISPEPTPTPFVHIIQQGETLLEIAFRYGVKLENIVLANPDIDPNLLSIGDEIRIPGPEGEPVDILLPTPTPIPVQVKNLGCTEDLSQTFVCMVSITNTEEAMITDLSALITLYDDDGQTLDQQIAYAPINQIPASQEIPLIAVFTHMPGGYASYNATLLSAVQVTDLQEDLPTIEVQDLTTIYKADNRLAELNGKFTITAYDGEALVVRLVGVALDSKGEPIGMNIWDESIDVLSQEDFEFQISIFSLGPEIANVSLHAEVRLK